MSEHQVLITRYVPPQHHPQGHVFTEILVNIDIRKGNKAELNFFYPFTARISRREGHVFNHGCKTIEAAQDFVKQHQNNLELIAPEGKVRAFYTSPEGQYFYQGRSYKDEPHWRSDERGAAWLTETQFEAVVAEAATNQWTKKHTIERHVVV